MTYQEDFEKARMKELGDNFIEIYLGSILAFVFIYFCFDFYKINQELSLILCLFGSIFGFITILLISEIIFHKIHSETYYLCKRCNRIIKKDEVFCGDCKYSIKRSIRIEENKKYFNEYKKIIKEEKKKREKERKNRL